MSADPLGVECPLCFAREGQRCLTNWEFHAVYQRLSRRPHRARVKAAERAEREKVNRG